MKKSSYFYTKSVSGNLAVAESNLFHKQTTNDYSLNMDKMLFDKIRRLNVINKSFPGETPRPTNTLQFN